MFLGVLLNYSTYINDICKERKTAIKFLQFYYDSFLCDLEEFEDPEEIRVLK